MLAGLYRARNRPVLIDAAVPSASRNTSRGAEHSESLALLAGLLQGLFGTDFRSDERLAQAILQVSGPRSLQRGEHPPSPAMP